MDPKVPGASGMKPLEEIPIADIHAARERIRGFALRTPLVRDLPWRNNIFFVAFATKWLSEDGRSFTLNFTGAGRGKDNDSFNTVSGTFTVSGEKIKPPIPNN